MQEGAHDLLRNKTHPNKGCGFAAVVIFDNRSCLHDQVVDTLIKETKNS